MHTILRYNTIQGRNFFGFFVDLFFVKTIQELMQIVKKLREEVEAQVSEIKTRMYI